MPGLLKFLYEQLSYHKILPFVCNLSMKISVRQAILAKRVLRLLAQPQAEFQVTVKGVAAETGEPLMPVR